MARTARRMDNVSLCDWQRCAMHAPARRPRFAHCIEAVRRRPYPYGNASQPRLPRVVAALALLRAMHASDSSIHVMLPIFVPDRLVQIDALDR